MAFKELSTLDANVTTALGGINKKTGKPNPTKVEGFYLGSRTVESKMSNSGTAQIHFLQTDKGNLGVWGKTDLDRKMKQITPGVMVRITQDGKLPVPGKQPMYKFRVEIDEDNTIVVAQPEENTLETQATSESDNSNAEILADDGFEDSFDEEAALDEVQTERARPAARTASAPDAARQQKVKELLAKRGNKSA